MNYTFLQFPKYQTNEISLCHLRGHPYTTSVHFSEFMTPLPPLVGSDYLIGLCSKSALRRDPLPPPLRRRRLWMAPY